MESVDHSSVHEHALEALAAADMMLAHAPMIKLDEVHTIDKVDSEWLTKVLGVPGAKLEDISILGGHEGMTSRHKWRLTWEDQGPGAKTELPTDLFIKSTPESPQLREMLSLLHMGELEAKVYTVLQHELRDLIPKSYYARSYPGGRFLIVLEDLEARGIKPYWIKDFCSIDHARAVAVAQAKIHSKFWNSDRFNDDMVWVRPRSRRFGEQWLRKYFAANRTSFLESEYGKRVPEYARTLLSDWQKDHTVVYDYWETKPQTMLHGDSHLGNTLGYADGSAGYYDWQCLFRGYGYRDLAYFIMTALPNAEMEVHERDIFNLYTDTLEKNGIQVDREEAWKDYCLFIMEAFDALIATITNGGYGHAPEAVERQLATLSAAVERHDVSALLARVIKMGSV
jgi:hypothetical protein